MKTVTKIAWEKKSICCSRGGNDPAEKTTLILTRDAIQFTRSVKRSDYIEGECLPLKADESWTVAVKYPNYPEIFDAIAKEADEVASGAKTGIACEGQYQALTVYYDDQTETTISYDNRVLLDDEFLRDLLSSFLSGRMLQAAFGKSDRNDGQS